MSKNSSLDTPRVRPDNMTPKEFNCLELFIKYGNKTRAGIEAGYAKKSAAQAAARVINSDKGQAYLAKRFQEMDSAKIADADEVMEYLTAVMRGEVNDQFDLDPPLSERTRAANELAKRLIDNQTNNNIVAVQIINDIPREVVKEKMKKQKKRNSRKKVKKDTIPAKAKLIKSEVADKKKAQSKDKPKLGGSKETEDKPKPTRRRIVVG